MKVLICDDEVRVCTLIVNLVEWKAYSMEIVGTANNGVRALELIRELRPDLVITDIRMPGKDGLELISEAKSIDPDLKFIIISGYSHFEYAQTAIKYGVSDYLLKPIKKDELCATLGKMERQYKVNNQRLSAEERVLLRSRMDASRLRNTFFSECLLSDTPVPETVQLADARYRYNFGEGIFRCFIVKPDFSAPSYSEELCVLYDKALGAFQRLKDCCFDFELFKTETRIYGLYSCASDRDEDALRTIKIIADSLLLQKPSFPGAEITVCVGSAEGELRDIKKSLENAVFAMYHRLISLGGRLIRFDNITPRGEYDRKKLSAFCRELSDALEIMDTAKISSLTAELEQSIAGDNVCGKSVFDTVNEIWSRFLLLKDNLIPGAAADDAAAFFAKADNKTGIKSLFELLGREMAETVKTALDDRESAEMRPVILAKEYIRDNYMLAITLEQVSAVAGFNPSYFSTFFKKKCSVGFLEYLSQVRVEAAKKLLKETRRTVSDICEAVGYSDIKHFTKTFKKLTGVTPAEYRRLYS